MIIAPVPLHRKRLFLRRFNQATLLSQALAEQTELEFYPDLLFRTRKKRLQRGLSREKRFLNLAGAVWVTRNRSHLIANRSCLIVDDVMTSGATLSDCKVCLNG